MSSVAAEGYIGAENRTVEAANGRTFAYRGIGSGEVPIVLLQHFRGNLQTQVDTQLPLTPIINRGVK